MATDTDGPRADRVVSPPTELVPAQPTDMARTDNTLAPQDTGAVAQVMAIISQGLAAGIDADTMQALVAMRREARAEDAKSAFLEAVRQLQAEAPVFRRTQRVSYSKTNYSFAPLDEIAIALRPILHQLGLSYRFTSGLPVGGYILETCTVSHKDGHEESSDMPMPLESSAGMNAQQKVGSAKSYARRCTRATRTMTACRPRTRPSSSPTSNTPTWSP